MTIRSEPTTATGFPANSVEQALSAAVRDGARVGELLDELCQARLWVPLPDDGRPVTDGHALTLPTVRYLDAEFVPAFTSVGQLDQVMGGADEIPHAVVPAAELARLLPAGLGIALNPGAAVSVPIYPQDVAHIASTTADVGPNRIRVGHPPDEPTRLLDAVAAGLRTVPSAESATRAWLTVDAGQGLVISVTLDDPGDGAAQQAVLTAVEDAAATAGPQFPVDVTFPGECEPGPLEQWAAANAAPFYVRADVCA